MKNKVLCVFLALVMAFAFSAVAIAAGGEVQDIGSWSDPTTGEIFKFVNAKSNDAFRQNQSIIYVIHTSVQKDERTGKWAPKTDLLVRDAASSDGFWNNFGKGGMAGLFQAAGLAGFGALLRPSNTSMIDNSGANSPNSGNVSGVGAGGVVQGGSGGAGGAGGAGGKATSSASSSNFNLNTNTNWNKNFNFNKYPHGTRPGSHIKHNHGNHFGWDNPNNPN